MTTRVEVDAHAGWPVKVTRIFSGGTPSESRRDEIVLPDTTAAFYVYSGCDLLVHEINSPTEDAEGATIAPGARPIS